MLKCGQALLFYFPPWHVDLWYPCQRSFSHWFFTLRSVSSPVYNWATHTYLSSSLIDNFCPNGSAAEKSLQSCPNLCDPIDGSPQGSPVLGILEARIREWVAISFSNTWKWKVKVKSLSRVRLLATQWTAAYQAPPSMGFSRQEYRSGVPLPSPPNGSILGKQWKFWDTDNLRYPGS